ncbi:MAG TPA: ATP-binding protein [Leptolyngbya sp.]|jgi:signal transduction histidine kinase|nr:ATP-binding protein [Leptolyngbya sp.]
MEHTALQQRIQALEKENRILQKKLQRSQNSQLELEKTNERKEALLRKAIEDLQESRSTTQSNHEKLQHQATALEQTLTELRRTQAQLIQSEKMSSLGQLVAGVAHEINNPINFIYGNLLHVQQYASDLMQVIQAYQDGASIAQMDALTEDVDLPFVMEDFPSVLRSMQMGASRIEEIVGSLRTFSRLDEAELKRVNLHEGLDSTLMILGSRLSAKQIQVIKHYETLPKIECYAGALNQVFMHLLTNAIDALNTRSQTAGRDWQPLITLKIEMNSSQIRLCVADNGTGIPEHIQTQIFDPFFTTKPIGQGTGLGLSIAYQIIEERHHGTLRCHSVIDQGTEFLIELPLSLNSKRTSFIELRAGETRKP